ncbi:hypothetical protein [Dyadobacter helix]|nr:hypothetical protein [Dyadobacter sp. CECT 9275]
MKNMDLPDDGVQVIFTDHHGVTRQGVYRRSLNGFMEPLGDEGPEDSGNFYPEADIAEWEYVEPRQNPASDFMVIF